MGRGKAAAAKEPQEVEEDKEEEDVASVDLTGLAEAWEGDSELRRACLERGSLIQWQSPKLTGVVTLDAVKHNVAPLMQLLKIYLPQVPEAKTCCVDDVKDQVLQSKLEHAPSHKTWEP